MQPTKQEWTQQQIKEILSQVIYPQFSQDIVSYGFVKDIIINDGKKTNDEKCIYEGGEVYNYDDGKTYNLKITIESNGNLTLRASIDKNGWLGETLTWTPLSQAEIIKYEGEKPDFKVVEDSYADLASKFKP